MNGRIDGRAPAGRIDLQQHVRRLGGDFREIRLASGLEQLARYRGNRDRRLLQVLLTELRGNYYLRNSPVFTA